MILAHEQYVADRFDAVEARFRADASDQDYRLRACVNALGPDLRGLRLLDLGCGKGRFARLLENHGADVIGLDLSRRMLASADGLDCVLGSALRLPFIRGAFDGVIAIEVFEHLPAAGMKVALQEIVRVLRPGGRAVIVDKNALALDAKRPWVPKLVVKWLDEHRGRWMYPSGGPVRERWFRPGTMARLLRHCEFRDVKIMSLLSPEESRRAVFRLAPWVRLMTLWTASAPPEEATG